MYDISKLVALILAFCLGFASCGGMLVGGTAVAVSSFKVRDVEKYGLADLPDEAFMGDDYIVDPLDMTIFQMIDEMKYLTSLGDDLTINCLEERYDLIINENIDKILTDDAREMPLKKLMSSEGIIELCSNVYIGTIEKYECHAIDSTEIVDPSIGKEASRWYDPVSGKYISGIGATIAYFTLADFLGGGISVDSVLHGIVLADVLGYTYTEDEFGNKTWYDSNGDKVTGIMAVFADCTLDDVHTKINTVEVGQLIGYEKHDDGFWYSEGDKVHPFMNAVADGNINSLGGLFDDLKISDLVPEEDRTGIFAILPADTKLNDISGTVNDSISGSPMQFFMNQGMISFEPAQQNSLDTLCSLYGKIAKISPEDYAKYYEGSGESWSTDGSGNYLIPEWRTKPLNESFSFIVGLLTL